MTRMIISLIHLYRWMISPFFPAACRFKPTCSRYAIHALENHGLVRGLGLIINRLARCHPYEHISLKLGAPWGYDPVPGVSSHSTLSSALPSSPDDDLVFRLDRTIH